MSLAPGARLHRSITCCPGHASQNFDNIGRMPVPTPTTEAGAAGLRAILERPRHALLAFDFDGVLSPIVADPSQSRPHPDVVPVLTQLATLVGSLSIITGRPAADVISRGRFGNLADRGQLAIFGLYGLQRWDAASRQVISPAVAPGVAAAREELPQLLADLSAPPGVTVEDKGSSLAVHTRCAAEPSQVFRALRRPLAELAARHGLALEPGRLVLDLRPPGIDKGVALVDNVRERGASAVAFFGDDLGDLAAYDAVDALRADGVAGVKVCSASDEVAELALRADLIVNGPPGVVAFLVALADAINGSGTGAR